jgi:thioesterase domain-containing protein
LLGIAVSLITFFRAPTIAQLAEALRTRQFADPASPIVTLKSSSGRSLPLFCLPGLGSDTVELWEVAQCLGDDRCVYGIQPSHIDRTGEPLISVESIASWHIESLRSRQSSGPYYLIGYSFGGMIAYEMARQLTHAREKVAMLALIDSCAPGYPRKPPAPVRMFLHVQKMLRQSPEARADYLRHRIQKLAQRLPIAGHFRFDRLSSSSESIQSPKNRRSPAFERAMHSYRPAPYFGPVLLCSAAVRPDLVGSHHDNDPLLGWGQWLKGDAQCRPIPGTHLEMVKGPNAIFLAKVLRAYLDSCS